MNPLDLLILSLATFYAAYALTQTKGPCDVFSRFRRRFPLGGLTGCIYCVFIWAGAAFYLALQTPVAPLAYPFAAAGAATFIFRWTGGAHID